MSERYLGLSLRKDPQEARAREELSREQDLGGRKSVNNNKAKSSAGFLAHSIASIPYQAPYSGPHNSQTEPYATNVASSNHRCNRRKNHSTQIQATPEPSETMSHVKLSSLPLKK